MNRLVAIPLPLAHVGSVNAWLLRGDPVTLIDTGPRDDGALAALEAGLRREGLRVEDIELLLATHHHLDHVGLAATIQRRSGAAVAVLDRVADYARALRRRGRGGPPVRARADGATTACPEQVVADTRGRSGTTSATRPRTSAPTCGWPTAIACGPAGAACGSWRGPVTARPTRCSSTTATRSRSPATTCWRRSPPTRRSARPTGRPTAAPARACATWRASSARGRCRSTRLLTGHGAPVTEHGRLVDGAPARPSPPLRAHPRRPRRRPAHGVRDRRRPVAGADGDASSRCSSSGRWSATSSCCSRPALWPSAAGDAGSVFELTPEGRATQPASALRRRPRRRPVPDCAGRR